MDESRQLTNDPWLFEGPPRTLPTAGSAPGAVDGPWSGSVFQPVRHFPGYGEFVGYAVATWYKTPARVPEGIRDPNGKAIDHGRSWGERGAPRESYERVSHPERFAPLEDALDALVGHLETSYRVKRVDAVHPGGRSIALHPDDPLAAPLRLELNKHQGQTSIRVSAGLLHDFVYPSCGCDACDESVVDVGEELEETVLGVVAGGFAERIHGTGTSSLAEYCLNTLDGDSSGSGCRPIGTGADMDPGGAAAILALIPNGWHPWPLKVESTGVQ